MSKPLKIAIYSGEIPSTTFIERLIFGLSKKNCKIYLFGYLNLAKKYSKNIHVYGYNDNRLFKFYLLLKYTILLFLFKRKDKLKLDAIIKSNYKNKAITKIKYYPVLWHKPDIFHLQWSKSIEDWIWVKEFGIKFIVSLRGAHINYSPLFDKNLAKTYKDLFPKVDGFHAVSNAILKEAEKYCADKNITKVIYSGLPNNDKIFTSNNNNDKIFTIISVGRNHWKKGYNYAIDCCKILKEKEIDFQYQIIGAKGSEELEYLINAQHLNENIILTNKMPFNEVQQHIKTANLLLLSSVEEGIANVVLEAMQLGTLVLSTNCGGMEEVIENGKNGFIVPIRDVEKMVSAIIEITKLKELEITEIIKNAKQTIKSNFTEESMIKNMLTLYQQVYNK